MKMWMRLCVLSWVGFPVLWLAVLGDAVCRVDALPCTCVEHLSAIMPCMNRAGNLQTFKAGSPWCKPTHQRTLGGRSSSPSASAQLPCTVDSTTLHVFGGFSLPRCHCTCLPWTTAPDHILKAQSRSILSMHAFPESNKVHSVVPDECKQCGCTQKAFVVQPRNYIGDIFHPRRWAYSNLAITQVQCLDCLLCDNWWHCLSIIGALPIRRGEGAKTSLSRPQNV